MSILELQEKDLLLIQQSDQLVIAYLDAVNKDEIFEIKKKRWMEVKKALSLIESISPELKERFLQTHEMIRRG